MTSPDIAYHFTGSTLRDGSPIPPIGETLVHPGKVAICESGYHWARTPWEALQYAPGCLLHRVQIGGEIIERSGDKGVSSERTIIASIDAEHLCRRFACDQALSVAHMWDMPPIVREYLTTMDESKRVAAWAAADAAWAAVDAAGAAGAAAWATRAAGAAGAAADAAGAAGAAAWATRAAARATGAAWAAACAAGDEFNNRVYAAFELEATP